MPSAAALAGAKTRSLPASVWRPHKRDLVRSVPAPTSRQGRTTPSCSGSTEHLLGQSQPKSRGSVTSLHPRGRLPSLMLPEKSEDRHPQHKLTSRSNLVKIKSENAIKSKFWEIPALRGRAAEPEEQMLLHETQSIWSRSRSIPTTQLKEPQVCRCLCTRRALTTLTLCQRLHFNTRAVVSVVW